ncbi:MAG: SCO family protein [Gammaproteobacteria bacterium]|nr:SCO family protein [Gammaproteobacteria bacterium]
MNPRIRMILVIAVFVVSPIGAWLFHSGVLEFEHTPGQGKNYGDLVHPARPLDGFKLFDEQGNPVDREIFLGQWTMLEIANRQCVEDCKKNIYKMRQIRLALGKDAYRVQRMVLTEDMGAVKGILSDNPGTLLFRIAESAMPMLKSFPDFVEGDIPSVAGRIYIVDPLGNLMMKYPENADPSNVLKDLRQLLKATWIRPKT